MQGSNETSKLLNITTNIAEMPQTVYAKIKINDTNQEM